MSDDAAQDDDGFFDRLVARAEGAPANGVAHTRLPTTATARPKPMRDFQFMDPRAFLAADYRVEYLVEGVLLKGQSFGFGGLQKTLKTTLMLDMAASLASGTPWLGRFAVPRARRVAVVTCESGGAVVRETIKRICFARGVLFSDLPLYVSLLVPKLSRAPDIDGLADFVEKNKIDVLVLEPLYMMLGESAASQVSNVYAMGALLSGLTDRFQPLGTTLVFCHHYPKNAFRDNPDRRPEPSDLAQAGMGEFLRSWALLKRAEAYVAGSGEHKLWCEIGGSAGHGGSYLFHVREGANTAAIGRTWSVEVTEANTAQKTAQDDKRTKKEEAAAKAAEKLKAELLAALAKYPNGETKATLRTDLGVSGQGINAVVATALKEGLIVRCNIDRRGSREAFTLKANVKPGQPGQTRISPDKSGSTYDNELGPGHTPIGRSVHSPGLVGAENQRELLAG